LQSPEAFVQDLIEPAVLYSSGNNEAPSHPDLQLRLSNLVPLEAAESLRRSAEVCVHPKPTKNHAMEEVERVVTECLAALDPNSSSSSSSSSHSEAKSEYSHEQVEQFFNELWNHDGPLGDLQQITRPLISEIVCIV
jgi:hypothetical protein